VSIDLRVLARLGAFTTDHVVTQGPLGVRITARVAVHHSQQGLVVEQAAAVKRRRALPVKPGTGHNSWDRSMPILPAKRPTPKLDLPQSLVNCPYCW
jgi:hypothetical protein